MPRASTRPKVESFNFRVDPELKAAFTAATAEEDRPAGQVLRELEADLNCDEVQVMRWMEDVSDTEGWTA